MSSADDSVAQAVAPQTTAAPVDSRARLPRTERRAQLLAAARDVFVAHGYHAAGMEDIAARAGVSKPVLYQHFPGKLDLYLALLDASGDELVAAVDDALESTPHNKQRVAATVEAYFAFVDDPAGAFRLVFESDLTNEVAVSQRIEAINAQCAALVSRVIHEDAGLDSDQSMLLAVGLIGVAQVTARYWAASGSPVPRDEGSRLIAALSWRGIGGFPRTTDQQPD
jgi:AcrR family transcriptional regulator